VTCESTNSNSNAGGFTVFTVLADNVKKEDTGVGKSKRINQVLTKVAVIIPSHPHSTGQRPQQNFP
jgi:hypothetical protein